METQIASLIQEQVIDPVGFQVGGVAEAFIDAFQRFICWKDN